MIFNGLPLHPLVLHAAVVLVPLTLVFAVLAFVPRIRKSMTIVAGATGVIAFVFVFLAKETGEDLQRRLPASQLIQAHAELAEVIAPLAFLAGGVLAVLALLELPRPKFLVRLRGWAGTHAWTLPTLRILGALLALAAVVDIVFVGDSGATAVWQGRL